MKLSTEDRFEIEDLYRRYAYGFDEGDGDAWRQVFTPDGAFVRGGDFPDLVGSDELAGFVEERHAVAPKVTHHTTNILIEKTAEGAVGRAYVLALRIEDGEVHLRNAGRYDDEFVQHEGRWRIRVRRFETWLDDETYDAAFLFQKSAG